MKKKMYTLFILLVIPFLCNVNVNADIIDNVSETLETYLNNESVDTNYEKFVLENAEEPILESYQSEEGMDTGEIPEVLENIEEPILELSSITEIPNEFNVRVAEDYINGAEYKYFPIEYVDFDFSSLLNPSVDYDYTDNKWYLCYNIDFEREKREINLHFSSVKIDNIENIINSIGDEVSISTNDYDIYTSNYDSSINNNFASLVANANALLSNYSLVIGSGNGAGSTPYSCGANFFVLNSDDIIVGNIGLGVSLKVPNIKVLNDEYNKEQAIRNYIDKNYIINYDYSVILDGNHYSIYIGDDYFFEGTLEYIDASEYFGSLPTTYDTHISTQYNDKYRHSIPTEFVDYDFEDMVEISHNDDNSLNIYLNTYGEKYKKDITLNYVNERVDNLSEILNNIKNKYSMYNIYDYIQYENYDLSALEDILNSEYDNLKFVQKDIQADGGSSNYLSTSSYVDFYVLNNNNVLLDELYIVKSLSLYVVVDVDDIDNSINNFVDNNYNFGTHTYAISKEVYEESTSYILTLDDTKSIHLNLTVQDMIDDLDEFASNLKFYDSYFENITVEDYYLDVYMDMFNSNGYYIVEDEFDEYNVTICKYNGGSEYSYCKRYNTNMLTLSDADRAKLNEFLSNFDNNIKFNGFEKTIEETLDDLSDEYLITFESRRGYASVGIGKYVIRTLNDELLYKVFGTTEALAEDVYVNSTNDETILNDMKKYLSNKYNIDEDTLNVYYDEYDNAYYVNISGRNYIIPLNAITLNDQFHNLPTEYNVLISDYYHENVNDYVDIENIDYDFSEFGYNISLEFDNNKYFLKYLDNTKEVSLTFVSINKNDIENMLNNLEDKFIIKTYNYDEYLNFGNVVNSYLNEYNYKLGIQMGSVKDYNGYHMYYNVLDNNDVLICNIELIASMENIVTIDGNDILNDIINYVDDHYNFGTHTYNIIKVIDDEYVPDGYYIEVEDDNILLKIDQGIHFYDTFFDGDNIEVKINDDAFITGTLGNLVVYNGLGEKLYNYDLDILTYENKEELNEFVSTINHEYTFNPFEISAEEFISSLSDKYDLNLDIRMGDTTSFGGMLSIIDNGIYAYLINEVIFNKEIDVYINKELSIVTIKEYIDNTYNPNFEYSVIDGIDYDEDGIIDEEGYYVVIDDEYTKININFDFGINFYDTYFEDDKKIAFYLDSYILKGNKNEISVYTYEDEENSIGSFIPNIISFENKEELMSIVNNYNSYIPYNDFDGSSNNLDEIYNNAKSLGYDVILDLQFGDMTSISGGRLDFIYNNRYAYMIESVMYERILDVYISMPSIDNIKNYIDNTYNPSFEYSVIDGIDYDEDDIIDEEGYYVVIDGAYTSLNINFGLDFDIYDTYFENDFGVEIDLGDNLFLVGDSKDNLELYLNGEYYDACNIEIKTYVNKEELYEFVNSINSEYIYNPFEHSLDEFVSSLSDKYELRFETRMGDMISSGGLLHVLLNGDYIYLIEPITFKKELDVTINSLAIDSIKSYINNTYNPSYIYDVVLEDGIYYVVINDEYTKINITLNELSLSINNTESEIYIGETLVLNITKIPSDLDISYSSDNTNVLSVNNGIVTGIGSGEAIITASSDDIFDTIVLKVKNILDEIKTTVAEIINSSIIKAKDFINDLSQIVSDLGNSNVTYNHYDNSNNLVDRNNIITGDKLELVRNNNVIGTYTLVLPGDVNSDGDITPLDYVKIKNHIMGENVLTIDYIVNSADVNSDGDITPLDYVRVKNYIMNGGL